MIPPNRFNFVPTQPFPIARPVWPGTFWSFPSGPSTVNMFQRAPISSSLPNREMFRAAFLALPWDPKHYEAADRLARQLSLGTGGGVMSKQMVTLTCSYGSPDAQEDFWKFLEDVQGVKVPWKAGATLTWRLQKQAGWINFDLWADPNLF